jgi:putative heme-binding domain-containing protein
MNALAHRPTGEWFDRAVAKRETQTRLRALVASYLRREPPAPESVRKVVASLLTAESGLREDQLDLLRVLALFIDQIQPDAALRAQVESHLQSKFPAKDRDVRWEQIRLLGEYRVGAAFPALLRELESEADPVTQFHLAQALSFLSSGWSIEEEQRAVTWLLGTQRGWFAEAASKGREFPEFWMTVLADFGHRHQDALLLEAGRVDLASPLGGVLLGLVAQSSTTGDELMNLFEKNEKHEVRLRILHALRGLDNAAIARFLEDEHEQLDPDTEEGAALNGAILEHWAVHLDESTIPFLIYEGLFHDNAEVVRTVVSSMVRNADRVRTQLANDAATAAAVIDPPPPRPATTAVPLAPRAIKKSDAPLADLAGDILSRMVERPDLFAAMENVLVIWSQLPRPGFKPGADLRRRPDEASRAAALTYWKGWYSKKFGKPFEPVSEHSGKERTDEELHRFLLGTAARDGNARRGAAVYETLQCQTCHGGGAHPDNGGRFFGPDLTGVTRRLSRPDLADALVYPSKQVADRFKAVEIKLKDGAEFSGFVTEQNAEAVTMVDREQVRRVPRAQIQSLAPLSTSLMPERLLNRLSWEEIKDLVAFLEQGTQ